MDKDGPPKDFSDWIGLREVPDWAKARWIGAGVGVLIALILVLALAAAVTLLLRVFDPSSGASGNLGTGALVVAILGAPFVIWNIWIKSRALGFQKEGHITDRINKAVEHLGAEKTVKRRDRDDDGTLRLDKDGKAVTIEETVPNIEVRIGGLLSLERIAQDSTAYDKSRDHVRVMEILCAYVRENAPARTAKDHPLGDWEPLKEGATEGERKAHAAKREERFAEGGKVRIWARSLLPPREDVAQALMIIGRRTAAQRASEALWGAKAASDAEWVFDTPCPSLPDDWAKRALPKIELDAFMTRLKAWQVLVSSYAGYRLDLRYTNLQRADLSGHVLSCARLEGARMEGAELRSARLEAADISRARMEGARLGDTLMQGAILNGAWMEGAFMGATRLEGARLSQARMDGASVMGARMQGATLDEAQMEGANISLARMEGANLSRVRMERASIWTVRMEGANLREARMEGVSLFEARMEGADLTRARLDGSCLREAQMDDQTELTDATLRGALVLEADWSSVPMSAVQVDSMFGDATVILPGGVTAGHLDWPAHWPVWELSKVDSGSVPNLGTEYHRWLADPDAYVPPPPPDPTP